MIVKKFRKEKFVGKGFTEYGEYLLPTIEELHEATQMLTNATIKQILNGQGLYFGYECERSIDNDIPNVSDYDKIEQNLKKHNPRYKLANSLQNQFLRLGVAISRNDIYKAFK